MLIKSLMIAIAVPKGETGKQRGGEGKGNRRKLPVILPTTQRKFWHIVVTKAKFRFILVSCHYFYYTFRRFPGETNIIQQLLVKKILPTVLSTIKPYRMIYRSHKRQKTCIGSSVVMGIGQPCDMFHNNLIACIM